MYDIRNISDLENLITTIKLDKITYVYYKNDIYNTLYVGYTQQQNKKKIHYLKNHHKMGNINGCFDNCIYIRIFLNCSEELLVYILKPVLNSSKSHTFNNNKLNYCGDINKNLYMYDPNILTKNIKNKNYNPNLLKYNNCDCIDERCKIINIYKNSFEIKQIYDSYMIHKKHKLIELLKYKLILCHLQINKQEYKKYLISQTQDCNYEFIYILLYCKSKYYIKSFKIIKDIIDKFKIFLKLHNIENEIICNKQNNNYFSIINYLLKMYIHKQNYTEMICLEILNKFIIYTHEDLQFY